MKTKLIVGLILIIAFFWFLPEPEETQKDDSQRNLVAYQSLNDSFLITNVRIYDGEVLHESSDILVENNRVVKVGNGILNPNQFPELDATGKTLLPGLIDAHTHVWADALSEALNFGVTTELDMFSAPETGELHLNKRNELSNVSEADLFSATILATAPGGHGTEYGIKIPVLDDVSQVKQFVADRVAGGADYIKAVYNAKEAKRQHFPSISLDILKALVEEAKVQDRMLVVHVDNLISAKHAIQSGADGIIHSFMDEVIDEDLVSLMKSQNAFIIPTFSVEASIVGKSRGKDLAELPVLKAYMSNIQSQQLSSRFASFGIPHVAFKRSQETVLKLHQAGVIVLAGSDAPNPGTTHGVSLHDELTWLVDAGLSPQDAIHAATGAVRKAFPVEMRGTLLPGALASMVLIDGNPFKVIEDTQKIEAIWKNGVYHQRKIFDLNKRFATPLEAGDITLFAESDEKTNIGVGISTTSDQFAGGKSLAQKKLVKNESSQKNFLRVSGEVKKGFSYPWSGVAYIPGKSFEDGANLEQLSHFVFDAKGRHNEQPLSVLVFQAGSFQPAVKQLTLSTNWQTYEVDLSELNNIDIRQVVNISIVATAPFGEFEFDLDNLKFK